MEETIQSAVETAKATSVTIDGTTYTIKKLKFGGQVELAGIMAGILKGMNIGGGKDSKESDASGESKSTTYTMDIGTLLSQAPDKFIRIVALGLNIEETTVVNFNNEEEVMLAAEMILDLNPVGRILGKSTTLLKNINLS